MKSKGEPHSVWLLPEDAIAEQLRNLIGSLSVKFGTHNFAPHLTVLGELSGSTETTVDVCRAIFEKPGPITATVSSFERSKEFFMAAFLTVNLSKEIDHFRTQLFRQLGHEHPPKFRPHVSLAYGLPTLREIDEKALKIMADFIGNPITFDKIAVVKSTKFTPIDQWAILNVTQL